MLRTSTAVVLCLAAAVPAAAQLTRISVSTAGVQGDGSSWRASVTADGRFVAFDSDSRNLIDGELDPDLFPDVFLRDRDTDTDGILDEPGAVATTRISVGPGGVLGNNTSWFPAITPDGHYIFFFSDATNLVVSGPTEAYIYRVDCLTGTIVPVMPASLSSGMYDVSADGNIAVYGRYVRDIAAGTTSVIPAPYVPPPGFFPYLPPALLFGPPSISADGTRIGYVTGEYVNRFLTLQNPRVYVYERTTATWNQVPAVDPVSMALGKAGTTAIIGGKTQTVRQVLATGAEEQILGPGPAPFSGWAGISADQLFLLDYSGRFHDDALGVTSQLGFEPGASSFTADHRWLLTSSIPDLPGNVDTNGDRDIFAIDLRDYFDADHDTMDDRWETLFGVTDPAADPDGDGQTNAQEEDAGTHPNGQVRRFLAEGATGSFFHTAIALANPGGGPAAAVLTFDRGDGTRVRRPITIPARRSTVVDVGAVAGLETADVSTTIESDSLLGIQRTMTWGASPTAIYGSHAETASPSPSTTWFLAEGSTVLDFDLFYLLQNPQPATTHATVRYLLPSGTTITRTYDLAPGSRTTIHVNQIAGLEETDVSGEITADAPIVVERAMYRTLPGQPFGLGTESMGVPAAATSWFLAEGATGTFFDLFVLVANPGAADATVEALYAKPDGTTVTQTYTVRAHSRHSVYVDSIPGLDNTSVATTLTSTNGAPIVAERAMYWPGGFFDYYEGHTSAGSTSTALEWVVAGGEDAGPHAAQTVVLIANTENRAGEATVTVLLPILYSYVVPAPIVVPLPANSRTTVPMTNVLTPFGVRVQSTGPSPVQLVVESAVYRSDGGVTWSSGSNALATPAP